MLFASIFTFVPLMVAATFVGLWCQGMIGTKLSGVVIQSLTAVPLAYTFRQRAWTFVSDLVDLVHGGDDEHEKTLLYKLFMLIRHGSVRGRIPHGRTFNFLLSAIELCGLVLLVVYFVGGLLILNYG